MLDLLIIVAVILGIIAISKVIQVLELANNVKGTTSYTVSDKDNKMQARMMPAFLIAYFAFIVWQVVKWGDLVLPVAASEHGAVTDQLLDITWMIIIPVFIVTHILLFYFAWKYVYDKNRKAQFFAHSTKLEMLWTTIPALVLLILILYGLSIWGEVMTPLTEDDDPIEIELYARQFDWTARYPGEDGQFGEANVRFIEGINMLGLDSTDSKAWDDKYVKAEFHLPVNRPVQFYFRAQDVIHSAFMPHFRAQMNAVPGMINQFAFIPNTTTQEMRLRPEIVEKVKKINKIRFDKSEELIASGDFPLDPYEFDFLLLCNKICGASHYNMQMKIIVETEEKFNKWIDEQQTFKEFVQ